MSKAVGGYVRRCERVKGTIVRNMTDCFWCGISFEGVKNGLPHPVNEPPHPRFVNVEFLKFEQFDVGFTSQR